MSFYSCPERFKLQQGQNMLEHINIVVSDLNKSIQFYQAAFPHWKIRSKGESTWYGKPRTWLHFGDDYHYIAFSDHGEGENRNLTGYQVGLAHFAFVTNNLNALIARMQQQGFYPDSGPSKSTFRRNVYYIDNDGFEVEFVEYLSDSPSERNCDE